MLYYLGAALCGLFCIAQQFTWETLVQVQCGASCQFSNLGTKASSEVASHYRTSVKNAGSILSMDLSFRNRLSVVTGKQSCGRRDEPPAEATTLRCGDCFSIVLLLLLVLAALWFCRVSRLLLHCRPLWGALSVAPVPSLSIIYPYKQDGNCQHIVA